MSYDEAALEQLEGAVEVAEFIKNVSEKKPAVLHEACNLAMLDSVDVRLLRIIRELDR